MPTQSKVEEIKELMEDTDIPGLSMATITNGIVELTALGKTNCGFYKINKHPTYGQISKYDSSRYLLTDRGLYFYNFSDKQLKTVIEKNITDEDDTEYDANIKKIMDRISQDLNYQKFNEIPALKAHQLNHIEQQTGRLFTPEKIEVNTQFGAASLSKPVFFYLILIIIEDAEVKKELKELGWDGLEKFGLDTKLDDLLPGFSDNSDLAKKITVGMALSHQTGVHDPSQNYGAPEILFEPGTEYGYSNFPLVYLQMILEIKTGKTLEYLAQEYVFKHCEMENSTFLKLGYKDSLPEHLKPDSTSVFPADIDSFSSVAANSLRTTAEDYAKFMLNWMNDTKLLNYLTNPVVYLTKDGWAKAVRIEDERLKNLAWGHGIGLQLVNDKVTAVFHNGDMNQWRAVITMDPINKTGTIFFSNSHNGDVLTHVITEGVINAKAACNFMRDKLGFAMTKEDSWEANQINRMKNIDLVVAKKSFEAAKLNYDRLNNNEKKGTLAEEKLQNASKRVQDAEERFEKAEKALEQLTKLENKPTNSNVSSNSIILSNLKSNSSSPAPTKNENITPNPPQNAEKKEPDSPKSSENDSYKSKSPFDISSGPKPK